MSIFKRGRIWHTRFQVAGRLYQRSTRTSNRNLAQRIERHFRDQAIARQFQVIEMDPVLTFGELQELFRSRAELSPFHRERLKQVLPHFGDERVMRLTKSQIDDYRRERKANDNVTDATVNRDLSVLRRILNWAVDEKLIPANPLGRLRLPPERSQPRPVMSPVEEDALLATASIELQPLVVAALDTGMRRGELLHQRWEHVDFARAVLFVSHSKTAVGEGREIPLTRRLYKRLSTSRRADGIIFEGLSTASLGASWGAALRHAQLRHFRFHDLRHTFNTRLLEAGVISDVRMVLMGHSSGQRVHARYTHISVAIKREAIARLEAWVKQEQRKGGMDGTEIARFSQRSIYQEGSQRLGEVCRVNPLSLEVVRR